MNDSNNYKIMKTLQFSILVSVIAITSACDNSNDGTTQEPESTLSSLNDTGLILYTQNFPPRLITDPKPVALTLTPDTSAPGQDADKGQDADPNNSNNDGIGGFKFTKKDINGGIIENQTKSYSEEEWYCVKDENTGLTWEVKTLSGLQQHDLPYSWYDPNENTNGGNAGEIGDNTLCFDALTTCNTNTYIAEINALNDGKGLCGSTKWRLPLREELRTLIDYSVTSGPMIDTNFFPNASLKDTWTSQTSFYRSDDGTSAWEVHFDTGQSEEHKKDASNVTIRLVH